MLDDMSEIPLYRQLADVLAKRIEAKEFAPRSALPSEAHLQQEYGVSRGTVRSAMKLLRDRGLVVIQHGRGTRVVG